MAQGDNLIYWSDVRKTLLTPEELEESAKYVAEAGQLLKARDAGKLTDYEYRQRCFELDKKYGIATDEDYDFYFEDDDDDFEEVAESDISDEDSQIVAHF